MKAGRPDAGPRGRTEAATAEAPAPRAAPPRRRVLPLVVTSVLFAGWIGYLAVLAFSTRHPVVLSRPQFLVAGLHVIADLDNLDDDVRVEEVVWPEGRRLPERIHVLNLKDCQGHGWAGPGRYVLALEEFDHAYQVAPTPPSPGYGAGRAGPPRIYPLTPDTRAQLARVRRPVGHGG